MIKFFAFIFSCTLSLSALAAEFKIVDTLGKPVSGIAVYLTPVDESKLNKLWLNADKTLSNKTIISQQDKKFTPYLAVTSKKNSIIFDNKDDITHHIYSVDKDNSFDFKLRSGEKKSDINFAKQTTVAMGCNIHDWMAGHLLVVETPLYGLTDDDGKVVFSELPAMDLMLKVYHPQLSELDNDIEINVDRTKDVSVVQLKEPQGVPPLQKDSNEFDFIEGYE
ncbi:hypothetical protein [Thalassomonas sp. M1454]|uniref:hypothetical protein n=1 Tax=Thalassomonas sp. M1454 TaxID=2594477 RepID=UPI00117D7484|nr:hypothetical protein [Thalassomonas sp. M1454]TRX57438.1 hypothetical protein FNN08_08060 [Thalassomonas sp. M1454]